MQCLSAVDLALWDLVGKLRNEPVYALLGGRTKATLPVYCTTARPDLAKQLGFVGAKIPCPYGPSAGDAGFAKNVAFFRKWREAVGLERRGNRLSLLDGVAVRITHWLLSTQVRSTRLRSIVTWL